MPSKQSTFVLAAIALSALVGPPGRAAAAGDSNPYLWLAQIHGSKALAWVEVQNGRSDLKLKTDPVYARERSQILDVLNANSRIPEGMLDHGWVLNFWQSADHVRGIWRRTTIADYARQTPHWQTLLDVDRLDTQLHKDWVWQGADCTATFDRCLVRLSPGGGDAAEVREYDPRSRSFIPGGFALPVAKSRAQYVRPDTVLVATDFGPGSMTPSSYPRIVKLWRRGTPLTSARTVFEGRLDDMGVEPAVFHGPYGTVALIIRRPSFFSADYYVLRPDGSTLKLPLPADAQLAGVTRGQLIATLQKSWTTGGRTIGQGALIAFPVMAYARTGRPQPVAVLYTPGPHAMIDDVGPGQDAVYASIYENVTGAIHEFRPTAHGKWSDTRLNLPRGGSTSILSTNDWGPQAYFTFESFVAPPSLYAYGGHGSPQLIKSQQAVFDARAVAVRQYWATSRDGTKMPYFLVSPKKAKGPIPTILYGYGGFQLSLTPWYWNEGHKPLDAVQAWVSRGGAIAVANIRGGGEFGPAWHQAALKYHRQRAYDDFEAVAADIERRGFSTPQKLGIVGASNGGLLVSTVMVERPDLFGAVVCQRPLIDMLIYTHYGAGASWVGEYGDPADPKMAAYIRTYSPFQNVKPGVDYPPVLFVTETTDDRVTPVFGRMMAAKMEAQGHDVLFNEATEGGHGPGATHAEEAEYWALAYTFFAKRLGLEN